MRIIEKAREPYGAESILEGLEADYFKNFAVSRVSDTRKCKRYKIACAYTDDEGNKFKAFAAFDRSEYDCKEGEQTAQDI